MINKAIINAVLNSATKESKDKLLNELFNHIYLSYDYNDNRGSHLLEMLVDPKAVVTIKDVNLDYINENLNLLKYNNENYNIRNIKVDSVDNIDCNIKITYDYLEKVNENKDDVSYTSSYSNINFIDYPDILKN